MISSGTVVVLAVQVSMDIGSFPSADDLLFFSSGCLENGTINE